MTTQASSITTELSLAVIVGSVRVPRLGPLIANWFVSLAEQRKEFVIDLIDLADVALPLADIQPGGSEPSAISDRLANADAFVVVTPEYNHSFPAALKNAIDWHLQEWKFKPVAFVSYGAGSGGTRAVEQLRLVFAELSAVTTRNGVAISAPWTLLSQEGVLRPGEPTENAAHATLDELAWWANALRSARLVSPYPA